MEALSFFKAQTEDLYSLWKPRFEARPVHARFMDDKVTLGQVFLWILWFPVRIIPPVPHNHLYLNTAVTRRKDTWSLGTLKQSRCVLDIVQQCIEKHFHITFFKALCCNITWSLLWTFSLKSMSDISQEIFQCCFKCIYIVVSDGNENRF
jgi:hypothetical protein